MFRRIIVAYDGSDRAQDALALALRLRDPDEGELTLACAISERPWLPGRPRSVSEAVSDETELMLAAGRRNVPAAIRVSLRVPVASSPARALTELAEDEQADLIIVGSSRRSPAGHVWLERTAGRLLQGARARSRSRPPTCARPTTSITSASPTTARPRPRARSRRATRSPHAPAQRSRSSTRSRTSRRPTSATPCAGGCALRKCSARRPLPRLRG